MWAKFCEIILVGYFGAVIDHFDAVYLVELILQILVNGVKLDRCVTVQLLYFHSQESLAELLRRRALGPTYPAVVGVSLLERLSMYPPF